MSDNDRVYWAAETDERTLAQNVYGRYMQYLRSLERMGILQVYRAALARYFGKDPKGFGRSDQLVEGGEQGELILAQSNHFRSITRSLKNLATSARPAFEAMAEDDSSESLAAVTLAERLWEYELDHGLERHLEQGAEWMLVVGESTIVATWDADSGEIVGSDPQYDPDTGEQTGEKPLYAGDLVVETLCPWDVARDLGAARRKEKSSPWRIIRRRVHRWELLSRYQDAEGNPLGGPHENEAWREIRSAPRCVLADFEVTWRGALELLDTDMIDVFELYHERTPALPEGRYVRIVGNVCLEPPMPLPYRRIPAITSSPAEHVGLLLGYSDVWDLMGLCEALDGVITNLVTMSDNAGDQVALIPEGADIDARDLAGRKSIEYRWADGMPPPSWMTAPEIREGHLKLVEIIQQQIQTNSGVNSVVRGDPEASLKSGAALALVSSMAVQNSSMYQSQVAMQRRDVGTLILEVYQDFATAPRVIDVVGADEQGTVEQFVGQDLKKVRRIRCELANPLMRTVPGRKQIADELRDMFPGEHPLTREQWTEFLNSGRLNALWRADRAEAIGIREECEALSAIGGPPTNQQPEAQPPQVLVSDNHAAHVREHKALLDGRQRMKLSPQAILAIGQHIDEHLAQWQQATQTAPAMLAATGQQPAPMPMPMMPPGAPPPDAGGPPAPPNGKGPPGAPPQNLAPAQGLGAPPPAAKMPVVPGTGGKRYTPPTGPQ